MSTYRLKRELKPKNIYNKDLNVQFRLSAKELAVAKQKAALYTNGNLSHWIRAALKNYKPKRSELEIID